MKWHVSRDWLTDHRVRVLLLTDSAAAWRSRHRFVGAGCAQLYVDDGVLDIAAVRACVRRWRPDLVLASLRAAAAGSSAATYERGKLAPTAFVFQAGGACWSRTPCWLRGCSERERLAGLISLVRFLQAVRHEGMPCVDFADFGAWLACKRTIVFASRRLPPLRRTTATALRVWLHDHQRRLDGPVAGAFCIEGGTGALWHCVHDAMYAAGITPAFGAMPVREPARAEVSRLSIGLAVAQARSGAAR